MEVRSVSTHGKIYSCVCKIILSLITSEAKRCEAHITEISMMDADLIGLAAFLQGEPAMTDVETRRRWLLLSDSLYIVSCGIKKYLGVGNSLVTTVEQ